jgi:Protein of unknown function (DUF2587)
MDAREPEIVPPQTTDGQPQAPNQEFIQQPAKLMRIAAMVKELLGEVRQSTLDDVGRKHLRQIHERALAALRETLSDELQNELQALSLPLGDDASQSEIRIAQAQLVGWLEGLFQGIQAALWSQHMAARAQLEEMGRRRGLPPGMEQGQEDGRRPPGNYL